MTTDKQLTPEAQRIVPTLRQRQRIERRSGPLTAVLITAAIVVLGGLLYLLAHAAATDEMTQDLQNQGQVRASQISGIQDQLKGVCRKVSNPSELTPQERDGCYRAENSIPPEPVTVTQVPVQSGLTAEQVQAKIDAALAQVPRPLTVEQVAATAQQVFAVNAPALSATPEKLASAVAGFCAGDQCRGPQGAKGEPAPAVTDQQVQAQVDAYCAANNGCVGPAGPPPVCETQANHCAGPQGISVVAFSDPGPHRTGPYIPGSDTDPCRITVTLIDPETAQTHPEAFNVPVAFCYG